MLYIKLFIEREKNIGQSAPECPFNMGRSASAAKRQGILHCLQSCRPVGEVCFHDTTSTKIALMLSSE